MCRRSSGWRKAGLYAAHGEHVPVLDVDLDAADGMTEAAEAPVRLDHRALPPGYSRGGGSVKCALDSSSSVRTSFSTSAGLKNPTLYTFRTRCCPSSRKTLRTWRKSPVHVPSSKRSFATGWSKSASSGWSSASLRVVANRQSLSGAWKV